MVTGERRRIKTKYSKELENFLNFLRQCEADMKAAAETKELMDKQTQDILHHIELKENSLFDYICLGLALRGIRKKRREAKDTEKILTSVLEWISANRKVIDGLSQVLGRIRKEEKVAMSQRYYINRTDIVEKVLEDHDE